MKKIYIALIIGVVIILGGQNAFASKIKYYGYDEGIALGKSLNKKVFLKFYAHWCNPCKLFDRQTLANEAVASYMNENFISIKINADRKTGTAEDKRIVSAYKVGPIPTFFFLTEQGEPIGRKSGFLPPSMFKVLIEFVHTESYKSMSLKQFIADKKKKKQLPTDHNLK